MNEHGPAVELPSMAYRIWFLTVMMMLSASVGAERYMMAVMVGPIKADLGLSDTQIGLAKDLAVSIVYIVAVIPLARVADRWSKRKIVAISAAVWSIAVLVCGQARSFVMLLLGRATIGLGEGGFTPPSQSWIADLFPMKMRATALAVFLLGPSIGHFVGPAVGGALTQDYGWRTAMMLACIPGFILVPVVWFTLRDVPAGLADGKTKEAAETRPFKETVRELVAIRTFPLLVGAAALNALTTVGLLSWAAAFMERSHGMDARTAGLQMGSALFLGSVTGHTVGGPLADWLGRRDLRWYIWILMLSGFCAMLVAATLLSAPAAWVFPLFGLNMLIGGLSAAPLMAVVAGLAPAHSRSVAVAILMVSIQVIGLGFGPTFVGWMSDALSATYGQESLRIGMRSVLVVGIPSTIFAWLASRYFRDDFAAAGHNAGSMRGGMTAAH